MHKRNMAYLLVVSSIMALTGIRCSEDHNSAVAVHSTELDGVTGATPNGGVNKAAEEGPIRSQFGQPLFDVRTYRLTISGQVDSSLSLTWDELTHLSSASTDTLLMYCIEGWQVWGVWQGVAMADLLQKARVKQQARYILFRSLDGYSTSLPISYLTKYHSLLAYQVNGKPLAEHDGLPLRLTAFGLYGYKWAKWIKELIVLDSLQWQSRRQEIIYSDSAHVPLARRRLYEGAGAAPLRY